MGSLREHGRSLREFARLHLPRLKKYLQKSHSGIRLAVSAVALVLGFIGYCRLSQPTDFYGYIENGYKAMGLLVIHMPKEYPHLPIELQIARFALPLATVWLAIGTYLDYVRRPFRLYSAIRQTGHVVVCGVGTRAQSTAAQVQAAHRAVVVVTDDANDRAVAALEARGIVVVVGDLDKPETYARAGVARAAEMLVATGIDVANLRASMAIRTFVEQERSADVSPLLLVTECSQPDMAFILDGAFQSIREDRLDYRLLSPEANVARGLLPKLVPSLGVPGQPGAVLLLGFTPTMQAVFDHVLRNAPPGLRLVVGADEADKYRDILERRCPSLAQWPGLDFINVDGLEDLVPALGAWLTNTPQVAIVIDIGTDEANLRAALVLRRLARDKALPTGQVLVRQEGSRVTLDALRLIEGELIDLSRIYAFGSLDDECHPDLVFQECLDVLAKVVHADYRASSVGGEASQPWERLRETYRQASRHQADHIDLKLAEVNCCRAPADNDGAAFALEPAEVERLAVLEHHRWCVDRWLEGWVYGPVKDSLAKTHPALIPYGELTEEIQEFDRRAVRNLPHLAQAAGFAIHRLHHLPVDSGVFDDAAQAALAMQIEHVTANNEVPVLEIRMDEADGATVAEWAAGKVAFDLLVSSPISELRQQRKWKPLRTVLEAARQVVFIPRHSAERDI